MFTDMGLSKDLNDQFKERFSVEAGEPQGIYSVMYFFVNMFYLHIFELMFRYIFIYNLVDFSVLVLGTASWPLQPSTTNFIIPEEVRLLFYYSL